MAEQEGPLPMERFRALVDAYGADPACWPGAERARALILLVHSAEARALRAEAAALDALMNRLPAPKFRPALVDRVLARMPTAQPICEANNWIEAAAAVLRILWPAGPAWRPVGVFAGAAILGIALGTNLPTVAGAIHGVVVAEDQLAFGFPQFEEMANWP